MTRLNRDSSKDIQKEIDDNTLYTITDDSDLSLPLLQMLYPVGSIYLTLNEACPLETLFGTWERIGGGRVLQGADSSHVAGSTIEAGLPNITSGNAGVMSWYNDTPTWTQGALQKTTNIAAALGNTGSWTYTGPATFDASHSSSIYGNSSTVQPPALCVNIFRRIA